MLCTSALRRTAKYGLSWIQHQIARDSSAYGEQIGKGVPSFISQRKGQDKTRLGIENHA